MEFEDIPSMKELTMKYKKMSLQMHPDKNQGSDTTELFQELQQSYKVIGDQILANIDDLNNVNDKDECKIFRLNALL